AGGGPQPDGRVAADDAPASDAGSDGGPRVFAGTRNPDCARGDAAADRAGRVSGRAACAADRGSGDAALDWSDLGAGRAVAGGGTAASGVSSPRKLCYASQRPTLRVGARGTHQSRLTGSKF